VKISYWLLALGCQQDPKLFGAGAGREMRSVARNRRPSLVVGQTGICVRRAANDVRRLCFPRVENLLTQAVDSVAAGTIFLKGFEDGRILHGSCRIDNAPLRRKCELVFDNLVERASRENVVRTFVSVLLGKFRVQV
jgi:hypothetical protein